MSSVAKWFVGAAGIALTAVVVGWLTDGFRRIPSSLWEAIQVIRTRLSSKQVVVAQNIGLVPNHDFAARKIDIDLRSQAGINIEFNSEIPLFSLWFRITNLNDFEVWFDRMLIEVWVGQPTIYGGSILQRFAIPSGESKNDLPFFAHLGFSQQAQISGKVQNGVLQTEVNINVRAYFQAEHGWINVSKQLSQRDLIVKGAPKG